MLEMTKIRAERDEIITALKKRNIDVTETIDAIIEKDHLWRAAKTSMESIASELNKIAKEIFTAMWDEKASDLDAVDRIIEAKGLKQISDSGALEAIIDQVLAANQKSVEEFRAGKEKAFNALIGQIMKATQGKANPQQVNKLLTDKLNQS